MATRAVSRPQLTGASLVARVLAGARLIGLAAWRGVGELYNSEGLTHAAAIAYYALLSLFPFFLLLLSVLGSMTSDPAARETVVQFIFRYFPRQFEFMTGQLDAFSEQTVRLGIGGMLALIWASLGVFNAVSSAVNHAWGVEARRSFLMHRLISFVMMLSAGAVFLVAIVLASVSRLAETNWLWLMIDRNRWLQWMTHVTIDYAATALLIGCVALIFYFIPNTEMRFRWVWPGAVVTGLLWRGALAGFSWYARDQATWNFVHGSIAAVVIFLLWIYISAVILLYGVEMTAAYARLQKAAVRHPELAGQTAADDPGDGTQMSAEGTQMSAEGTQMTPRQDANGQRVTGRR